MVFETTAYAIPPLRLFRAYYTAISLVCPANQGPVRLKRRNAGGESVGLPGVRHVCAGR